MSPTSNAAVLIEELARLGHTLAVAESLTGGLVAAELTSVPGASRVVRAGITAYATDCKASLLGVPSDVLDVDGAVSGRTALAMAQGVAERAQATWGISTTGVAGPDTQEGKPVGLAFIGVSGPGTSLVTEFHLLGDRSSVRTQCVASAIATCLDALSGWATGQGAGQRGTVFP